MKIKIGKAKWFEIGRQAGWAHKESRIATFKYSNDALSGAIFGKDGVFFDVELEFERKMEDDSDYNRDTGYGKLELPTNEINIINFRIDEIESEGGIPRNAAEIQEGDPMLYQKILNFAMQHAEESEI